MYKYYNAHPKGMLVDDCVKRAICLTSRKDYNEVQRELNAYKKVTGAKKFYSDGNPRRYVEDVLGAERISFSGLVGFKRITAEQFCKMYPQGRYILSMAGHWSACINGNILDTWDCSDEYVNSAYAVTPVSDTPSAAPRLRFCYTVQKISDEETNVTFYDGNGQFVSKTMYAEDARIYADSLSRRGYPDMSDAEEWL